MVVGVENNTVVNMTIPLPSGAIATPQTSAGQSGMPFLWPNTSIVWPCGEGLPDGSAVTPQGVYGGEYVTFSYAALPNGTSAALPEDCSVGSPW